MARRQTNGNHDAKRVEIAEAASQVFLRLGLERTSLADIAREMGYTTGVLRHYFADKEELLLFAKNLLFDRLFQHAKNAADRVDDIEKLHAIVIDLLPSGVASINRYRLLAMFNGSAIGDPRLMKQQGKRNLRNAQLLQGIIETLQKKGLLKKDLDARIESATLHALIDGLADQVIMRPNAWSREELIVVVNRHLEALTRSTR